MDEAIERRSRRPECCHRRPAGPLCPLRGDPGSRRVQTIFLPPDTVSRTYSAPAFPMPRASSGSPPASRRAHAPPWRVPECPHIRAYKGTVRAALISAFRQSDLITRRTLDRQAALPSAALRAPRGSIARTGATKRGRIRTAGPAPAVGARCTVAGDREVTGDVLKRAPGRFLALAWTTSRPHRRFRADRGRAPVGAIRSSGCLPCPPRGDRGCCRRRCISRVAVQPWSRFRLRRSFRFRRFSGRRSLRSRRCEGSRRDS
jgi:hypothetical protein